MCGSLRRENNNAKVGQDPQPQWIGRGGKFRVTTSDGECEATFNDHARGETVKEKFLERGWKRGELHVNGYTEQGRQYDVPKGFVIDVVTRAVPGHGTIFNIVTRPAEGAELEVHPRFPVMKRQSM